MPREATITFNQVAAVADAIKAGGGRPNSRNVRERLGTGSMGTIHKLLNQWAGGQARQANAPLALPPALQRAVLDFMDKEIAATRAGIEADLVEARQEGAALATENERQLAEIERQGEDLAEIGAAKASAEGRLVQVEADLASGRGEIEKERQAAEVARIELAKALLRLEGLPRLEGEIDKLRAALEKERQERHAAREEAAELRGRLAQLNNEGKGKK